MLLECIVFAGGTAGLWTWWAQLRGGHRTKVAEMAYVPARRIADACSLSRNPHAEHDETIFAEYAARLAPFSEADREDLAPLLTLLKVETAVDRLRDAEALVRETFGAPAAEALHRISHEYEQTRTDALGLARVSGAIGKAKNDGEDYADLTQKRDHEKSTWLKEGGTGADQRLADLTASLGDALSGPLHFRFCERCKAKFLRAIGVWP